MLSYQFLSLAPFHIKLSAGWHPVYCLRYRVNCLVAANIYSRLNPVLVILQKIDNYETCKAQKILR